VKPTPDIHAWLESFASAVRASNLAAGKQLFAPSVHAFGTVLAEADGIEALGAGQWSVVWPCTRDFRFDPGTLRCSLSRQGDLAAVAGRWSSQRRSDGGLREGRFTLVLSRGDSAGAWKAIHSHFSITPTDHGQLG
jgi:ketosteroid isomerase-like protein